MHIKPTYHNLYYTARWKALRLSQMQSEPLCAFCLSQNVITNATVADHITPHKGNELLFYDADNLQSLCKRCHDSVKQTYEKRGVMIGSDADGCPLDANSHWFK